MDNLGDTFYSLKGAMIYQFRAITKALPRKSLCYLLVQSIRILYELFFNQFLLNFHEDCLVVSVNIQETFTKF